MQYNQNFLDKLRPRLPYLFIKELHDEINKGKRVGNRIPRQTIVDRLTTYRETCGKPRKGNGSISCNDVIDKTVLLLKKKGIEVPVVQ